MFKKLLTALAVSATLLLPVVAQATILFPTGGGTGSSTLTGILIGNGVSPVNTLTIGTGLTLTGTTLISTGSGSAFGYPFPLLGLGTSTGLMLLGSSTIGNGTQAAGLTINGGATTTGTAYFAGNVGIGRLPTSNALDITGALQVSSTINTAAYMISGFGYFVSGTNDGIEQTVTDNLSFRTAGVQNRLVISSNGNVGVGTTTPWKLLSVGTGNVGTFAISTTTSGCAQFSSLGELYSTGSACGTGGGSSAFPFTPTTNYGAAANSTSTPIFFTAGVEASTTNNFFAGLTVDGGAATAGAISIIGHATNVGSSLLISDLNTAGNTLGDLINPSGTSNVNLATVPLSATIQTGSGSTGGLIVFNKASSPIIFATGGNAFVDERLNITGTGNVGVGSTSPFGLFSVGSSNVGNIIISTSTAGCAQFSAIGEIYSTGSACGTGTGAVSSVTGTANQVTASPTTGAVVVSLPNHVIFPTGGFESAIASVTNATTTNFEFTNKMRYPGSFNNFLVGVDANGFANPVGAGPCSGGSFLITISGNGATCGSPTATYPIQYSGGVISTLFGTTTSWGIGNNGLLVLGPTGIPFSAASSTLNLPNTALQNSSVTVNGTSIALGASGTVTANTPNAVTFNSSGSGGSSPQVFNGSSAETISYNTIGAQVAGTYDAVVTATTPIIRSLNNLIFVGLATTSQPASSNILTSNGGAGVYGSATTSATCTGNATCSAFTILGSTPVTINVAAGTAASSTLLGDTNTFSGTDIFSNTIKVAALSGFIGGNSGTLYNFATSTIKTSQLTNDANFLTANQTITLTGAVTGSGATAITTAFGTAAANTVLTNATGATAVPTFVATSSLFQNASASASGLLTSTDWSTFNGKQAAGNYITALTGDGTASGPGSAALTLATVNGNVGSFTNANITVNAKGLITAASNGTIGGVTSVTATYPLASSGGTTPNITTAFGTTTNNGIAAGSLYIGSGGIFQSIGTSSITAGSGIAYSGTMGSEIGGISGTLSVSGLSGTNFSNVGANTVFANATGASAAPQFFATSTFFGIPTPGTVLAFLNGQNTFVATTTDSCSSGVTCSYAGGVNTFTNSGVTSIVAGTNITISGSTGAVTINATGGGSSFAYPFTPSTDGGINTSATSTPIQGTNPGLGLDVSATSWYGIGGQLLAYASSTNKAAIFGLNAGGQNATTSNVLNGTTAFGNNALKTLTSGAHNTAIGYLALNFNSVGSGNTAVGQQALNFSTGSDNTGIGFENNGFNISGSRNTLLGAYETSGVLTSGTDNVFVGFQAGQKDTTGFENILIGTNEQSTAGNITTGGNNIGIGNELFFPSTTANNQIDIGGLLYGSLPATTTAFQLPTSGAIGIGTSSPFAKFAIQTNNGDTNTTLFAIGSSTQTATSTLFSIGNTGATTLNTTNANAFNINDLFGTNDFNFSTASTTGSIFTVAATTSPNIGTGAIKLFDIDQYGGITASSTGSTPTLSCSPTNNGTLSLGSNDETGTITSGTLSTSCTITFAHTKLSAPAVFVYGTLANLLSTQSTTAFTFTISATTGATLNYFVIQP